MNSYTTWWARLPEVSSDAAGNFVVVWEAVGGGAGETWDGRGRRYDALGRAPGSEFRLNAYTTSNQQDVAVASEPGGDFLAVWMSESQDGDGLSVFGRRFAADPDLIFRDDFEANNLAAWSATATDGGDLGASGLAGLNATNVGLSRPRWTTPPGSTCRTTRPTTRAATGRASTSTRTASTPARRKRTAARGPSSPSRRPPRAG